MGGDPFRTPTDPAQALMALRWTSLANQDLVRLHEFLAPVNPAAAAKAVDVIVAGVRRLAVHPRLGRRLERYNPREVRTIVVNDYEVRYELREHDLIVLRLWHVREDR